MRLPRLSLPQVSQHIVIRGINSTEVFRCDHDYRVLLGYLQEAADKYQTLVNAYVLMPNHIHLLLTPAISNGVAKTIQLMSRQYVQYFNSHYDRTGSLWEGRYRSALVEGGECEIECCRYIETNPVRNGLVGDPYDYYWSSYRASIADQPDKSIRRIEAIGDPDQGALMSSEQYREFCSQKIPADVINRIRKETNRSRVIGGQKFVDDVSNRLGVDLTIKVRGGDRRSAAYKKKTADAKMDARSLQAVSQLPTHLYLMDVVKVSGSKRTSVEKKQVP